MNCMILGMLLLLAEPAEAYVMNDVVINNLVLPGGRATTRPQPYYYYYNGYWVPRRQHVHKRKK